MDARQLTNLAVALFGLAGTALLIIAVWKNRFDPVLTNLVIKNFPTIIGLPFAFVASFVVIALFRQNADPLHFKGFDVDFEGAAGEIVLWAMCFWSIAGSIKMLWRH